VKQYGAKNWKHIAQYVPERNHTQCLQRWGKVLAPDLVKGHWTAEEDTNLKQLITELANEERGVIKNWGEVANKISGRTSKQCRERWYNHLDPTIKRGNYTPEEDALIIAKQTELGNRWSIISALLPGRTEDAVKIRWKTLDRERNGCGHRATPKKPRKSKSNETQQQYHDLNNMQTFMPTTSSLFANPITESVRLMISREQNMKPQDLKVQTSLPNMADPWLARQQQPPMHPNSMSSLNKTVTVKTEQQNGPHRYRAESLEWLEDALLSPMPKGPTETPKGAYSLAKSIQMPERQQSQSHYDKQASVLRHASELLHLSVSKPSQQQPLQIHHLNSHQLTPPQTCHQAAHKMCINPPNLNLKDEDLDHFLTDMDLENLGGALEHRLSFN